MLTSAIYYYFLLYFVKTAYSTLPLHTCDDTFDKIACCNVTDSAFGDGVYLVYYNCTNNVTTKFPITEPEGLLNVIDLNKRLFIFMHGFFQLANNTKVLSLAQAVCTKGRDNVVLLDWGKYSFNINYFQVAKDSFGVGDLFAQALRKLTNNTTIKLDPSNIYPVGFSLGAHIAGFAIECNDDFVNKIPRITGLDPANPEFYPGKCYFNPSNRTGVDIIHTNMGQFGTCCSMGTQEVFVNGGRCQPDCPESEIDIPQMLINAFNVSNNPLGITFALLPAVFCSHVKALEIYTETVYKDKYAGKCNSDKYQDGEGNTVIGYNADPNNVGQYCITTVKQQSLIPPLINGTKTSLCGTISSCPVKSNL